MPIKKNHKVNFSDSKKVASPDIDSAQETGVQSGIGTAVLSQEKSENTTKGELANMYVKGFLYTISGALLYSWIRCFTANETKDIVLALSSTLSGPLGFIIGYYFKTENK